MSKSNENNFWNSFAEKYDTFINRFAKDTYAKLFRMLQHELKPDQLVLEIGTGTGQIAFAVGGRVKELTALDYSPEMIRIAREKLREKDIGNIRFLQGNAADTGFSDQSFDVVIASNVMHLLESPEHTLWEIHRVLRDDGIAILPTYCHGQNIKTRAISVLMGLSGFKAVNRWSVRGFRKFIMGEGFLIRNEVVIRDKIPLLYTVLTKQ